jgi:hypothetical protein
MAGFAPWRRVLHYSSLVLIQDSRIKDFAIQRSRQDLRSVKVDASQPTIAMAVTTGMVDTANCVLPGLGEKRATVQLEFERHAAKKAPPHRLGAVQRLES